MDKKYVLGLILIVVLLGIGYLYINNNKLRNFMSNSQKAYSISNVELNVSGDEIVFNHMPKPGKSSYVFIVSLPDDKYLVTKFSWLVVPEPVITQEENSTYLFANGKFAPVQTELTYTLAGLLSGKVFSPTDQDPAGFITINSEQDDMVSVNSAGEFKKITDLSGFENAVYKE